MTPVKNYPPRGLYLCLEMSKKFCVLEEETHLWWWWCLCPPTAPSLDCDPDKTDPSPLLVQCQVKWVPIHHKYNKQDNNKSMCDIMTFNTI